MNGRRRRPRPCANAARATADERSRAGPRRSPSSPGRRDLEGGLPRLSEHVQMDMRHVRGPGLRSPVARAGCDSWPRRWRWRRGALGHPAVQENRAAALASAKRSWSGSTTRASPLITVGWRSAPGARADYSAQFSRTTVPWVISQLEAPMRTSAQRNVVHSRPGATAYAGSRTIIQRQDPAIVRCHEVVAVANETAPASSARGGSAATRISMARKSASTASCA